MARSGERPAGRSEVSLQLDLAADDLAARPQHGLRRQPARARTTNRGQSWDVISPDLSTERQGAAAELRRADAATTSASNMPSRSWRSPNRGSSEGLIWAGTNDGQVQLTRDNGKTWTNVTANIPNLPPWGTVGNIEPSRYDAGTAYLTVDLHQVNNRDPFVYKTTDYGKSWRPITNGIPKSMLSYAHCIREDPMRRGLLYLGTENAIYVSFDDGEQLAAAADEHAARSRVLASPSRSTSTIWSSPPTAAASGSWTTSRRCSSSRQTSQRRTRISSRRARPIGSARSRSRRRARTIRRTGDNPPYGASINYFLKSEPPGMSPSRSSVPQGQRGAAPPGTEDRRH